MGLVLVIILLLLMVGGLPNVGGHRFGYGPSGVSAVVLLIVILLLFTGRL